MKVIIAGGRDFNDYELLQRTCNWVFKGVETLEIVSGGARGADKLGERYAKEIGLTPTVMKADWDEYGKAAGPIRNSQMAKYADALIAFHDGSSTGTSDMIKKARRENIHVLIIEY